MKEGETTHKGNTLFVLASEAKNLKQNTNKKRLRQKKRSDRFCEKSREDFFKV